MKIDEARRKIFEPIYYFLKENGMRKEMSREETIEHITDKYNPVFAQKVLDLWFALDKENITNIYYGQDIAFEVACEDIWEQIERKDSVYRLSHDTPLEYKEQVNTKKVIFEAVKRSKRFLMFKSFLYLAIILLMGYLSYLYYEIPEKQTDINFVAIGAIGILSVFLLFRVNSILTKWAVFVGTPMQKVFSYLILLLAVFLLVYLFKISKEHDLRFFVLNFMVVSMAVILLATVNSRKIKSFFGDLKDLLFNVLKIVFVLGILVVIVSLFGKACSREKNNHEKRHEHTVSKTVHKKYKKAVTPQRVQHSNTVKRKESAGVSTKSCQFYVSTSALKVRSGASKSASSIGTIPKHKKVCVLQKKNGWMYVKNNGWVYGRYLLTESAYKKKIQQSKLKKKVVKKTTKQDRSVWHCEARSKRASGWVEKVGKQNAIKGALYQCEIRRVTEIPCRINHCYRI